MNVPAEIFKAYDIRGIVGDTVTEEITFKIGQAIGKALENHNSEQEGVIEVVVGRL